MRGFIVLDALAAMVRWFGGTATGATPIAAIGALGGAFATEVSRWAFLSGMPISGNRRLTVVGFGQARSANMVDLQLGLVVSRAKPNMLNTRLCACEEIYGSAWVPLSSARDAKWLSSGFVYCAASVAVEQQVGKTAKLFHQR